MKSVLLGFVAAAALATAANAAVDIFPFTSPAGPNGTSAPYTVGGVTITASGFASNGGAATTLFDKTGGGDENGLGLVDDPSGDNEISGANFVQIDTNLVPAGSTFGFQMGSDTGGEEWEVFGSNVADSFGATPLLTGTNDESPHSLSGLGTFRYYDFKDVPNHSGCPTDALCGNVLLTDFTVTTAVPEPATWAMMLIGIGGLGATMRMSRKTAGAAALA